MLDLGCGPGYYARALAEMGFAVEAWDASREMVALAAEQGAVEVRQAVFDDLNAEARYDGIWANFSLLHARRADLPGLLARIRRAGKPGMVFHIGMKLGTGEGPDALGRFYAYYQEDELVALLNAAGLDVKRRWHGAGAGLDGVMARHVMMLCHG
ncbi:class I SAM-dependent methyltransferase [Aquicoccus sp. G2-2]|uniref:class I SAM-dependent methyltransferase n=1 Tax=Aquicoccus sp. G2-2 TaxID=3092120 RepID=UPI002AE020F8|nr:class I SAM-dependent methyltransferase [Aquicoccus sp. G2-2]MEA1114066.1 class I SAM-dependent methyltransferase [Aquicoccus sp. G2-2]